MNGAHDSAYGETSIGFGYGRSIPNNNNNNDRGIDQQQGLDADSVVLNRLDPANNNNFIGQHDRVLHQIIEIAGVLETDTIPEKNIYEIPLIEAAYRIYNPTKLYNEFPNKLGEGSFGSVFRAIHNVDEQECAIKYIRAEGIYLTSKPEFKEVHVLKNMTHKNIVKYVNSLCLESDLFIMMEFVDGIPLNKVMKEEGMAITNARLFQWTKQLCSAVNYLHVEKMIFHRDLKHSNILLKRNNQKHHHPGIEDVDEIKIVDFGVSLTAGEGSSRGFAGTYRYASLEKYEKRDYDGKDDVWAIGCVMIELLIEKYSLSDTIENYRGKGWYWCLLSQENINKLLDRISLSHEDNEDKYFEKLISLIRNMLVVDACDRHTSSNLNDYFEQLDFYKNISIFNVRRPVSNFIGRKDQIAILHDHFVTNKSNYAIALIIGDMEIGKTELVLEYIRQHKTLYGATDKERVFWINGKTEAAIISGIEELCDKVKKPIATISSGKASMNEMLKEIYSKLDRTLWIFHNVDNVNTLKQYLPSSQSDHHVLITSQKSFHIDLEHKNHMLTLPLELFSEEESMEYIRGNLDNETEEDISQLLLTMTSRNPSTLSQMISSIRNDHKTIETYLKFVEGMSRETEERQLQSSIHQLRRNNKKIAAIMDISIYLFTDQIPISIFRSIFDSEDEFRKGIDELQFMQLIMLSSDHDGDNPYLYIRQKTRDIIQHYNRMNNESINMINAAATLLNQLMVDNSDEKEVLVKNRQLMVHCVSLLDHYMMEAIIDKTILLEIISKLSMKMAAYYLVRQDWVSALELIETRLNEVKEMLPGNEMEQDLYFWIGDSYHKSGQYQNAKSNFDESIKSSSLLSSEKVNRLIMARSLNGLGTVHHELDQYEQAEVRYQEALVIFESIHGHKHPNVAMCLTNLALVNYAVGKYELALPRYLEALSIREEAYQPNRDHPDIANSLHNIGLVYYQQNDTNAALTKFLEALDIYEGFHGRHHPKVATCLNNIGLVYQKQEKYEEALAKYQETCYIYEIVYDRDNPYLATTQNNIGQVYCHLRQFDMALFSYQQSLRIGKLRFRDNHHTSVALALDGIGKVYELQGKYDLAFTNYEEALKIYEAINGLDHMTVADALTHCGFIHDKQGQYDLALIAYENVLRIRQIHGDRPILTADCLLSIGLVYYHLGNYDMAMKNLQEARSKRETIFGQRYVDVAICHYHIGNVYDKQNKPHLAYASYHEAIQNLRSQPKTDQIELDMADAINAKGAVSRKLGKFDEAMEYHQEALDIFKMKLGDNDPKVTTTAVFMGQFYCDIGLITEAFTCYHAARIILTRKYSHGHPEVATILNHIGNAYRDKGDYGEAMVQFQEAMRIYESNYDENHVDVAMTFEYIGTIQRDQRQYEEALESFHKALSIHSILFNCSHVFVANCLNQIGLVFYKLENYEAALSHYQQALKIYESRYEREHIDIATCLNHIGQAYQGQKKFKDVFFKLNEALTIRQAIYGNRHSEVATTIGNIGQAYEAHGEYRNAMMKSLDALKIRLSIHQRNHPDTAAALQNVASVYCRQCSYEASIAHYLEAASIYTSVYGSNHHEVAVCYAYIGNAYDDLKRYDAALTSYKESLRIYEACCDQLCIAGCLHNIGLFYHKQSKFDMAISNYEESLKLYEFIHKKDMNHPDITMCRDNIAKSRSKIV